MMSLSCSVVNISFSKDADDNQGKVKAPVPQRGRPLKKRVTQEEADVLPARQTRKRGASIDKTDSDDDDEVEVSPVKKPRRLQPSEETNVKAMPKVKAKPKVVPQAKQTALKAPKTSTSRASTSKASSKKESSSDESDESDGEGKEKKVSGKGREVKGTDGHFAQEIYKITTLLKKYRHTGINEVSP